MTINWRYIIRTILRVLLLPLFIVQLLIVLILGIIPTVCACVYYQLIGRHRPPQSSDEWVSADAGPKVGGIPPLSIKDIHYENFYFTVKDGTKLAVDVWLPPRAKGPSAAKVGCVLLQARYFRSFSVWYPGNLYRGFKPLNVINEEYFAAFVARGMAIVVLDIRGTGASFGTNTGPWKDIETEDSLELIDWIVAQPWSNGKVGTFGISYEGTAALLTAIAGHSAVKATCPMYVFLDVYSEVAFPGGLKLFAFLRRWEQITRILDDNAVERLLPCTLFLLDGVQPVSSASWKVLKNAVADHKNNWSASGDAKTFEYLDGTGAMSNLTPIKDNPSVRVDKFLRCLKTESGTVTKPDFFLVSGWLDVTAGVAMKLAYHLQGLTDVQLLISTWNHAGIQHARFYPRAVTTFKQHKTPHEVADFFYLRLQDVPSDLETGGDPLASHLPPRPPPVRYFSMQEEIWKCPERFPFHSADTPTALYLQSSSTTPPQLHATKEGGSLLDKPPVDKGSVTLPVDVKKDMAYLGVSRYTAMTEVYLPMRYDLDNKKVYHLRYTSSPLDNKLEVTGYPILHLYVSSSANDASLFVYLLCISADGKAHYVTEGMLRVSSRKLVTLTDETVLSYPGLPTPSFYERHAEFLTPNGPPVLATFAMQPTSYTFLPGQRVGLAVGGADAAHFDPLKIPNDRYDLTVHTGPDMPSRVLLPSPSSTTTTTTSSSAAAAAGPDQQPVATSPPLPSNPPSTTATKVDDGDVDATRI